SFLDGAMTPEELVKGAAALGMPAVALTDHNNLCGGVAFYKASVKHGLRGILGCEITLENGSHLVLLSKNQEGYSNLCRILTEAHLGSERREPRVKWASLEKHSQGIIVLSGCRRGEIPGYLLQRKYREACDAACKYVNLVGGENFYLELQGNFLPGDSVLNKHLSELGAKLQIGLVATNNCHYFARDQFVLHDLLTCVRTHTRLDDVHQERRLNGENYLKTPAQMQELFTQYPQALENSLKIAWSCEPPAFLGGNLFPEFVTNTGETAPEMLRRLTFAGAEARYGSITGNIRDRLNYELAIICQLGFADYFLLVWDLVQYARREQIRYAGRGSAADSAVAYCLYITEVDSIGRGLLFERFMSLERAQKPDIDIDFDSRYRDKVSAYVYAKYGADRVATVCTYNTYHFRSAIRELGKVMGFDEGELGVLAKKFPHYAHQSIDKLLENLPELRDSGLPLTKYQRLFDLVEGVAGFPRFIGTHLGGLVVCRYPLVEVTPLQQAAKGVVVTQFDKDYVEDLGLVKLDLLSLRTMSAIGDSLLTINSRETRLDYDAIPLDDKATYARLNKGQSIGVFQLESPAQRALQARLGADNMEDIIASVALIRPGPIQGNMVDPYINRRRGLEEVTYLHPKL
ncbi:MAG TPA: DNA polymerase III subunit alpha, partial [Bacillota bacterium]|nr:DNA polymerase III subunit alpha [Bacillota bacterium]